MEIQGENTKVAEQRVGRLWEHACGSKTEEQQKTRVAGEVNDEKMSEKGVDG